MFFFGISAWALISFLDQRGLINDDSAAKSASSKTSPDVNSGKSEGSLLTVTDENYESIVKDFEFLLIHLHGPTCKGCTLLIPILEHLAKDLRKKGSKIRVGMANVAKEKKIAAKHGSYATPRLLFFLYGMEFTYNGMMS